MPTATAPLPVVTLTHDPDTGPAYTVRLGAFRGPSRTERHAAEADADALSAALAPLYALAARVDALLASYDARDAVAGRCAAPASAALAVLRWVASGPPDEGDGEAALGWGDAPTLDRLGGEMAVVADGSGE